MSFFRSRLNGYLTDSGDIRYCIGLLNDSQDATNTIAIQVGPTIQLTQPLPDIKVNVKIIGNCSQTIQGSSGVGSDYRIFTIDSGVTAEIDSLYIEGGDGDNGGAIANRGSLTLNNDTITENTSNGDGGGIYNYTGATLSLSAVNITDNSACVDGGGIENFGTVTGTTSQIVNNTSGGDGGGIENLGNVNLGQGGNFQISGNSAGLNGGGIDNAPSATFTLSGTTGTIEENTAGQCGGGLYNDGTATLSNVNVLSNKANKGGGMYLDVLSTTNVTAVVVEYNQVVGDGADGAGVYMFPVAVLNNNGLNDIDDPGGKPVEGN